MLDGHCTYAETTNVDAPPSLVIMRRRHFDAAMTLSRCRAACESAAPTRWRVRPQNYGNRVRPCVQRRVCGLVCSTKDGNRVWPRVAAPQGSGIDGGAQR